MRARSTITAILIALALAATLSGCGDQNTDAAPQTTTSSTSSAAAPEQAAFDRVAKGHVSQAAEQKIHRAIARAIGSPGRPELWAVVSREIAEAARNGDGYDTGT